MSEPRQWMGLGSIGTAMAAFASRLRRRTTRPEPSADAVDEQPVSDEQADDPTDEQPDDPTDEQPGVDDEAAGKQVPEAAFSDEPAPLAD